MKPSRYSLLFTFFTVAFLSVLPAQEDEIEPYRILFPEDGLRSWGDSIEVTLDVDEGYRVWISGTEAEIDSTGRVRFPVGLEHGENVIPLTFQIQNERLVDTLQVFRMNYDHFEDDTVFINHNIPDDLEIHFVYPRSGSFWAPRVGLRGRTHPDAELFMEGDTIPVFPSGAFTTLLDIAEGLNVFPFRAVIGDTVVLDTLLLERPEKPKPVYSRRNPIWLPSVRPESETWVMAGDVLEPGFQAEPGQNAYFRIPGITGWREMVEYEVGHYGGVWTVPGGIEAENLHVEYWLKNSTFGKRIESEHTLSILAEPLGGMTIHPDSRVYDIADDSHLFFPLTDSIQVQVNGMEKGMYRIRLGETRNGWIWKERIRLDPKYRIGRPIMLGSMYAQEDTTDWHVFRLFVGSRRVPFEIKEWGAPLRLELKLYGAKQAWEWTTYPDNDDDLLLIERTQPSDDVWQMSFYPSGDLIWGWYAYYEGDYLMVGIKKPPVIDPENVFSGIRIEIDPGHGGWERGALGVTGYAEGDANLRYSKKLAALLEEAGATVFLTRTIDRQMGLGERAEKARQDSVHIFVWAHNNAPGLSRDLMEAFGSSTYYTWPSSKRLSDTIYPYLGDMGIETSGKVARYYYYMTRQTEYLVYLIEGAFMTFPEEEMFLLTEEGLDKLAMAAFMGLRDFLEKQSRK